MEEDVTVSLLFDSFEPFVFLERERKSDGEGGFVNVWKDGITIEAVATFNTSIEARVAEKEGVTSLYTITLAQGIPIEYHDVLRRVSDGKIFRVTSDGGDSQTPKRATFHAQQVTAEEWIPT